MALMLPLLVLLAILAAAGVGYLLASVTLLYRDFRHVIPFMMQAWWMFCLCSALFVIVSLLTPRPDPEKVAALTWKSPAAVLFHGRVQGLGDPRILAGGLLALLAVLYVIFH
jgi:hypothetical protein